MSAPTLNMLIEERRAMDGQPWYGHPFDFAAWLKGVNEGANPREQRQGVLL